MVEVAPNSFKLKIPIFKYVLLLLLLVIAALIALFFLVNSHFAVRSSWGEWARNRARFMVRSTPDIEPVNDFESAIKIHGLQPISSRRFRLFVSVTDKNARPWVTLDAFDKNLQIEDGSGVTLPAIIDRVRPLSMYDYDDSFSFSAVMDYSASMFRTDIEAIENNFDSMLDNISIGYSASIIKFNNQANRIIDLTDDLQFIKDAVSKSVPLQNTALYDAVQMAAEELESRPHMRFIVLTTDGNDNVSNTTLDQVLDFCKDNDISVFVFGFGWLNVDILERFARETHGYYTYVTDSGMLDEWFEKLAAILNNVQVIEFSTDRDMQRPSMVDLTITTPEGEFSATRNWQ